MTDYKTTDYKRFGNRWTINECLQLQREFELLNLSINEIAKIHQRTPNAIMLKLDREEFADYNVLYSNYHSFNVDMEIHRKNSYVNEDADEDSDEDEKEENSSEYGEDDCANDEQDDDEDDEDGDDIDDLKHHVKRIEKQLNALTEMLLKQNNKKSIFSMLS
jgi:hypothetical protein